MKQSTKVTIIFILLYFLWNFQLQYKLTKIAVEEENLVQEIENLVISTNRLKQLLLNETNRIEKVSKELKTSVDGATTRKDPTTPSKVSSQTWNEPILVLVLACNRAKSLRDHLEKLINHRPSKEQFPIVVSLDCEDSSTAAEAEQFGKQIDIIKHPAGAKANIEIPHKARKWKTYYYISRHYKLALNYVFETKKVSSVIITEDDLDIASDFFSFFSNTRYLLEKDPTLWCVSAWNDNGKPEHIDLNATNTLYRSDFVSGLGWMMTNNTWKELEPKWPLAYWDDWMREPEQRKDRQCIRPEISRTGMTEFGKKGASSGMFFKDHLARIKVNTVPVDFSKIDLGYLLPKSFEKIMVEEEAEAVPISLESIVSSSWEPEKENMKVKIIYTDKKDFTEKAKKLGIMSDFKAGVPRTAYNGTVTCFFKNTRIFLIPDRSKIPKYDSSW
ncbi:unnamed protein product [Caenorhabditis brenneri]